MVFKEQNLLFCVVESKCLMVITGLDSKKYIYFPFQSLFLIILLFLTFLLFGFYFLGVLQLAFLKLGFTPLQALTILILSLLGSTVNVPVKKFLTREPVLSLRSVKFFWVEYKVPVVVENVRETILAVNFGGAILPVSVSLYLLIFKLPSLQVLINVILSLIFVSLVTNLISRPVKGLGIAVPGFIPAFLASVTGLLLSKTYAPLIAYVSGTLGVLIGADLLNLNKIPELGSTIASIGGAGTFDGVFLTGIFSVLLTM